MSEEEVKVDAGNEESTSMNEPPEMIRPDLSIKKEERFGGYNLKDETVEKLKAKGVYMDGTSTLQGSKKESPKPDEKKEAEKKEGEEGKPVEPEEAGEPKEGQPEKPAEAKKEGEVKIETFIDKVNKKLEPLTEEERAQFLSDLESAGFENWTKFTKTNTEKAMKLADRERELGDLELVSAFGKFVSSEKVLKLLEDIKNQDQNVKELFEQSDSWFDDEEDPTKNPIRQLVNLFTESAPVAQELTKKQLEQKQKDDELEIKKEILDLQSEAPEYKDSAKVVEILEFADSLEVDLATAHKVKLAESMEGSLKESEKKVKALTKELLEIKKENEELKKKTPAPLKKQEEEEEVKEPVVIGSREYEAKSFDEVDEKLRKKFGLSH